MTPDLPELRKLDGCWAWRFTELFVELRAKTINTMTPNDSDAWRGTVDVGDCLIYVAVDGPHSAPHLMLSNSLGIRSNHVGAAIGGFLQALPRNPL